MATKRITKSDYLELEEKYNKLQEEYNKILEIKLETIRDLFIQVQELTKENKQLKSNTLPRKHNERNAGRKNKFTYEMVCFIVSLKDVGCTYLEIKQKFWEKFGKSISIASISNIVKRNKKNNY